jgi:hypothetical protein
MRRVVRVSWRRKGWRLPFGVATAFFHGMQPSIHMLYLCCPWLREAEPRLLGLCGLTAGDQQCHTSKMRRVKVHGMVIPVVPPAGNP